jgi:hypothetical protein
MDKVKTIQTSSCLLDFVYFQTDFCLAFLFEGPEDKILQTFSYLPESQHEVIYIENKFKSTERRLSLISRDIVVLFSTFSNYFKIYSLSLNKVLEQVLLLNKGGCIDSITAVDSETVCVLHSPWEENSVLPLLYFFSLKTNRYLKTLSMRKFEIGDLYPKMKLHKKENTLVVEIVDRIYEKLIVCVIDRKTLKIISKIIIYKKNHYTALMDIHEKDTLILRGETGYDFQRDHMKIIRIKNNLSII